MTKYRIALCAFSAGLVAGCGTERAAAPPERVDPAITAALNDQILIDPDLSRQNEGNAALTGNFEHALPLPDTSRSAVDAARREAALLVGGRDRFRALPPARRSAKEAPLSARLTVAARAAYWGAPADCVQSLRRGFAWAAQMPAQFPVYPRGATQEAAGTDAAGCRLRAVNFRTPVPLGEVLIFYHTRAVDAGFSANLAVAAGESVLSGERGGASFAVYGHEDGAGATQVDLIVRGI